MDVFAREGLRTLLLAKRELTDDSWRRWNKVHEAASVSLNDRELALEAAAEEIEVSMEVLGSTAIEDKLQVGVPDAISHLAAANIKIWVLTGDKEETAINIGFACQLLDDSMDLTIVNQRNTVEIVRVLKNMISKIEASLKQTETSNKKFALVVDGESLIFITRETELTQLLMQATRHCVAVIACRVSPKQKADVVSLVKTNMSPTPMTLSIGDGANDVPMIQEAHVGVGISGNEGMQAVRASDYAIAQFRFLENLLLQHGRMNYRRISTVILYSFYKNCVLVTMLFWFNFFNGFSGSALLNGNVQAMYNVIFTSFPVIIYGILDRDVEFKSCGTYPILYLFGQLKQGFNFRKMTMWMLLGVLHSLILMFVSAQVNISGIISPDGLNTVDRFAFGNQAGNYLVVVVNLKLVLETSYFAGITSAVYILTMFSFIIIVMILNAFPPSIFDVSGTGPYSFGVASYWLMCVLMGPFVLMVDYTAMYYQRLFKPNVSDKVKVRIHGVSSTLPLQLHLMFSLLDASAGVAAAVCSAAQRSRESV
jgi:phospholipid-translocating P-type ATPase (flippase)